jgi:hypothetical protein
VRLGLILIALSLCLGALVSFLSTLIAIPRAVSITLQALPLAGNLLCAFVPLKGPARTLSLTNLGVIALGMAVALLASRMMQRTMEASLAHGQELLKKSGASEQEEQDLRKKLEELRQKRAAGNKDAATEEQELRKKLTDLQSKRLAELLKESERVLAEVKGTPSRSLAGSMGFWGWVHFQGIIVSTGIQVIIVSFFIQAIALALGDKYLARMCPRVAALALLTLILGLVTVILPLSASSNTFRLLGWIGLVLWLISYVWQGIQLVEACKLIDNHINSNRAERAGD